MPHNGEIENIIKEIGDLVWLNMMHMTQMH